MMADDTSIASPIGPRKEMGEETGPGTVIVQRKQMNVWSHVSWAMSYELKGALAEKIRFSWRFKGKACAMSLVHGQFILMGASSSRIKIRDQVLYTLHAYSRVDSHRTMKTSDKYTLLRNHGNRCSFGSTKWQSLLSHHTMLQRGTDLSTLDFTIFL